MKNITSKSGMKLSKLAYTVFVVISMSQHLGAPANPIVEVGDTVKVGQKIGEAAGFISAPVHSSVSGTVVAVEPRMHGT